MFKKGDRVRVNKKSAYRFAYPYLSEDLNATVIQNKDGKTQIKWDVGPHTCYLWSYELELMEKDMSEEFKWGDDVEVQGSVYKFVGVSPICSSKGIVARKGGSMPSISSTFDLCKIKKHVPKVKGMTFESTGQQYVYEHIEGAEKGDIVKSPTSNPLVVDEVVEVEDVIKMDNSYKLYKLQK